MIPVPSSRRASSRTNPNGLLPFLHHLGGIRIMGSPASPSGTPPTHPPHPTALPTRLEILTPESPLPDHHDPAGVSHVPTTQPSAIAAAPMPKGEIATTRPLPLCSSIAARLRRSGGLLGAAPQTFPVFATFAPSLGPCRVSYPLVSSHCWPGHFQGGLVSFSPYRPCPASPRQAPITMRPVAKNSP